MSAAITSVHNPRIKEAVRLRDRKGRTQKGRILIDGRREIGRALAAGVEMLEVFYEERNVGQQSAPAEVKELSQLLNDLQSAGAELVAVAPRVMEKIAYGERNEGLVAVARPRQRTLDQISPPAVGLVAVLDGVEKPGNVGAVLRSADAAGVSAVLAANAPTDFYNPNAIRASLGAVFTVPVAAAPAEQVFQWLVARRLPIYAARLDAELEFHQARLGDGAAIVLGAESQGVSDFWRRREVIGLRLPMCGVVDSLNVSAAAAVLFYEAWRQREERKGSK